MAHITIAARPQPPASGTDYWATTTLSLFELLASSSLVAARTVGHLLMETTDALLTESSTYLTTEG